MRSRLLPTLLLCVLTGNAFADSASGSSTVSDTADLLAKAKIEGMKALPINGLQMVKAGGRTFFMSNNGRFIITGTLMDVWNRVAVTELDQVDQIAVVGHGAIVHVHVRPVRPPDQAVRRVRPARRAGVGQRREDR